MFTATPNWIIAQTLLLHNLEAPEPGERLFLAMQLIYRIISEPLRYYVVAKRLMLSRDSLSTLFAREMVVLLLGEIAMLFRTCFVASWFITVSWLPFGGTHFANLMISLQCMGFFCVIFIMELPAGIRFIMQQDYIQRDMDEFIQFRRQRLFEFAKKAIIIFKFHLYFIPYYTPYVHLQDYVDNFVVVDKVNEQRDIPSCNSRPSPLPSKGPRLSEDELCSLSEDYPSLVCPICLSIPLDPVVTSSGASYDRSCIKAYLAIDNKDPTTCQPCTSFDLKPNYMLRNVIDDIIKLRRSRKRRAENAIELDQHKRKRAKADKIYDEGECAEGR